MYLRRGTSCYVVTASGHSRVTTAAIGCTGNLFSSLCLCVLIHTLTSVYSNQRVRLESQEGVKEVTIKGLSKSGFLLAQGERGEQYELHPDGNSFDMTKNLLHKKLPPSNH